MTVLDVPPDFPLKGMITDIDDGDTMFDGRSDHYLGVGLSALRLIEEAFRGAADPVRILDLPCGFGRVTRILRARYTHASITACDLDRAGVDATAARFGARGVASKQDFRTLDFGEIFDLIWVGSLLTHLPEEDTRAFLDLAVRHMGPQSRLVVTTHGAHVETRLRQSTYGLGDAAACELIAEYRMNGYAFRGYSDDPHYGISLTSRTWFEQLVSGSALCLQSYQPRGWDRHQDALVLRLRPAGMTTRVLARLRTGRSSFDAPPRPQARGVSGFDEGWYRENYPDVAAAVASGALASGLDHYRAFGWKEGRAFCAHALTFDERTPPARSAYLGQTRGKRHGRMDEVWSHDPDEAADNAGWYWMAHPAVRARVNRLVSGDAGRDAYDRLSDILRERGRPIPIPRSASLGCGFGTLERDLAGRRLVTDMDAYDLAAGAVAAAERETARLGLTGLRFHVADLEEIKLAAGSVDVVFAHSSVHHVERLEQLYGIVKRTLRRGGLFHLNEFVGPTRFQWTDAQLALANDFLDALPVRLRRLPSGQPKERLRRPTIDEMIRADPSEAVRSAELVGLLRADFDILEYRPIGGAVLHLALGGIAQNFDPDAGDDAAILQSLFDAEDEAMRNGTIESDFAVIVACPKTS